MTEFTEVIKKWEKVIVAAVLAAMAVFGLVVTGGYGVHLDEAIELSVLNSNVKEYAGYIPGRLGDKLSSAAGSVDPISQSDERDHGISAYYGYVVVRALVKGAQARTVAFHAYTFCIFMCGVYALYGILKHFTHSRYFSLFGALMLYLSPRMFGEGHYNNKDIVLMAFALMTLFFGVMMIEKKQYRYALLFALTGAVATNTKIAGAWFFGVTGIVYLAVLIRNKGLTRKNVCVGLAAIAAYVLCYVLITPAMWKQPVEFIKYLIYYANDFDRWDNYILFDGEIYKYSVNPPPAWYLPKMILITTPLYVLALTAFGAVMTIYNLVRSCAKDRLQKDILSDGKLPYAAAAVLLLWVFPLVYAVVCGTRVYNGWRHFYFIYGPMVLTAAYGAWCIKGMAAKFTAKCITEAAACAIRTAVCTTICTVICTAVCGIMLAGIIVNNPTQYAYFNILAGSGAENRYEMDYWMVSTKNALMKLYENEYDGETIKLSSEGRMNANAVTKALRAMPENIAGAFEICSTDKAQYVFINEYGLILDTEADFDESRYEKAVSIKSYGREISAVYRLTE